MADLEFLDRQEELWALLRQANGGDGRSLAIFVHGFFGNHLSTWGQLPEMLRIHAQSENSLKDWDFLFLGYSTWNISSYLDIAHIVSTQWENASEGRLPFNGKYQRFALFGHSLGTLGIRQLLCAGTIHPSNMIASLHSVTLFGTPLNGSPLAKIPAFGRVKIAEALEPSNPQLRMLRCWNQSMHPLLKWKKVRLILGLDDKVVGQSAQDLIEFAGDAKPETLNFDHGNLVKPVDWHTSTIRDKIVEALR